MIGLEVHASATVVAVATSGHCRGLILLLGHEGLGGKEQGSDRSCVLQRRPGDLGRVNDSGDNQVFVNTGLCVEAHGPFTRAHLLNNHSTFEAGINGNLAKWFLHRLANDGTTGLLVVGATTHLVDSVLGTEQSNTPTGDDTLFDSGSCRLDRVLDAVLLLFELDLGGRADLDDGYATRASLARRSWSFSLIPIRVGVLDLPLDLLDPSLRQPAFAGSVTIDDGGVVLGDDDLAGSVTQHVEGDACRA